MKKNFLEKIEKIWNNLDIAEHQYITCKVIDDFIKYLENLKNITLDEIEYKLQDIEGILTIMNPKYDKDIKILNMILKERDLWIEICKNLESLYKK